MEFSEKVNDVERVATLFAVMHKSLVEQGVEEDLADWITREFVASTFRAKVLTVTEDKVEA